jgi:hypothetical protein
MLPDFLAAFNSVNGLDCLAWCLACSLRTSRPFYGCRRFTRRSLVASLLATHWSDSEFTSRLGIELPGDWQILSLLIRANTGSGTQTQDAIDLASVVSFVAQSFLHPFDLVLV